ncbi:hypothetical protein VNI00_008828 [Paramarasmius palmivorus]|uniref:Glycoside hydrolase family 76 protein n=1 Tax=Paramarasmius palmivorus TaxID=297713 RepID=A0AAW0CTU2_9AGAR
MEERIEVAARALDKAYTETIPAVNQTRYKDKVSRYFTTEEFSNLDPIYGYAAALAHVAYKDHMFLYIATEAWESNNNRVLQSSGIPPEVFQNTSDPKVQLVIDTLESHRKCPDSMDLSGGLIHSSTVGDMVTSENARFFRLSGVLAEITGDIKYLNAAQQSEKLFLSRLYTDDSLFWWSVMVDTKNPCGTLIDERKEPWNTGYATESLAILSSISLNETTVERLTSSILASSNYPQWHDHSGQGVLTLNDSAILLLFFTNMFSDVVEQDSGADLVRALATILSRKEYFNAGLSTYVEAYLAVQYNALLDLATVNGTNVYGNSWIGPPNMTYSAADQLSASRVLIAGININPQLDFQSPPEAPPAESSGRETNHIGGIIGGVLGGLSLIALVIIGSLFIIRRRHQDSTDTEVFPENSLIPIPYVLQSEKRRRKRHMHGNHPPAELWAEGPPPAYSESS